MLSLTVSMGLTLPSPDFKPLGFLSLLVLCALIIYLTASFYFIHRLRYPRRRGFGAALAHGLPTMPDEACSMHRLEAESYQKIASPNCQFEQHVFTFPDGLESPGWIIEGDHPAGPALIMNHGWGSSRYALLKLMPFFKPLTSKVVIYDQRGHGDIDRSSYDFTLNEWQDLKAVSDEVQTITDQPQMFYGASMGATIAIRTAYELAQQDDSRVQGLILESPSRYLMQPPAFRLMEMGIPAGPIMFLTRSYFKLRFKDQFTSASDNALLISMLKMPVLLMHGSDDWLCPLEDAKSLSDAAKDCRMHVFDMHEHLRLAFSHGEDSKRMYFEYLLDFFQQKLNLDIAPKNETI